MLSKKWDLNGILKVQDELKAAEKKASDAESEVTNCNKKILQMEEELDSVTEQLNSSITKVLPPLLRNRLIINLINNA